MAWVGSRSYGATLVAVAAALWSTGGLFVRALDLDLWTVLAWRALVFGAVAGGGRRRTQPVADRLGTEAAWAGRG